MAILNVKNQSSYNDFIFVKLLIGVVLCQYFIKDISISERLPPPLTNLVLITYYANI